MSFSSSFFFIFNRFFKIIFFHLFFSSFFFSPSILFFPSFFFPPRVQTWAGSLFSLCSFPSLGWALWWGGVSRRFPPVSPAGPAGARSQCGSGSPSGLALDHRCSADGKPGNVLSHSCWMPPSPPTSPGTEILHASNIKPLYGQYFHQSMKKKKKKNCILLLSFPQSLRILAGNSNFWGADPPFVKLWAEGKNCGLFWNFKVFYSWYSFAHCNKNWVKEPQPQKPPWRALDWKSNCWDWIKGKPPFNHLRQTRLRERNESTRNAAETLPWLGLGLSETEIVHPWNTDIKFCSL